MISWFLSQLKLAQQEGERGQVLVILGLIFFLLVILMAVAGVVAASCQVAG